MPDSFYDFYGYPTWINTKWEKHYDLAKSYKKSILVLLKNEVNESGMGGIIGSERDIFPILFLFCHYIELALKSLILTKEEQPESNNHDLKFLMNKIKCLHPDMIFSNEFLSFIDFIDKQDKKAQCFRYPFDKSGKEFFENKSKYISQGVYLSYVYSIINQIFSELNNMIEKKMLEKNVK